MLSLVLVCRRGSLQDLDRDLELRCCTLEGHGLIVERQVMTAADRSPHQDAAGEMRGLAIEAWSVPDRQAG